MPSILLVDDEPGVRSALGGVLRDEGYEVDAVDSGEACLERLGRQGYDVVVLDIWLPGMDGLATFARMRERQMESQVVMISGHGNIESAVRAIKMGAFDFVEKPMSLEKTVLVVRNALRQRRLEAENQALRAKVDAQHTMVGESYAIVQLREQVMEPVGGSTRIRVDARVLAATNKDLPAEIRAGRFREDLYFRLNVVPIFVPSLRERQEDIPLLADHFMAMLAREYGRRPKVFEPDAVTALQRYPWPGNVRELRKLVERLMILVPGEQITARDVAFLDKG